MDIWLKELALGDDQIYCNLLMELASYKDAYARPVPQDFSKDEFEDFKKIRVKMKTGKDLPSYAMPTTTYWVMDNDTPIGYATLKQKINPEKPGGHFGLCLKKEYQNKGIGLQVSELLSEIAYKEYQIEEIIYTAKDENTQSQRSIEKIGGELIEIHDGYHFYSVNIAKKYNEEGKAK